MSSFRYAASTDTAAAMRQNAAAGRRRAMRTTRERQGMASDRASASGRIGTVAGRYGAMPAANGHAWARPAAPQVPRPPAPEAPPVRARAPSSAAPAAARTTVPTGGSTTRWPEGSHSTRSNGDAQHASVSRARRERVRHDDSEDQATLGWPRRDLDGRPLRPPFGPARPGFPGRRPRTSAPGAGRQPASSRGCWPCRSTARGDPGPAAGFPQTRRSRRRSASRSRSDG